MAEFLGVVSSAFAVVSLAMQLTETVQKLHAFLSDIEDAPLEAQGLKNHISTLKKCLRIISDIRQDSAGNENFDEPLTASLASCKTQIDRLVDALPKDLLNSRSGTLRLRWSNLKIAMRKKQMEKIEAQLGSEVAVLLLAVQLFFHRVQYQESQSMKSRIEFFIDSSPTLLPASKSTCAQQSPQPYFSGHFSRHHAGSTSANTNQISPRGPVKKTRSISTLTIGLQDIQNTLLGFVFRGSPARAPGSFDQILARKLKGILFRYKMNFSLSDEATEFSEYQCYLRFRVPFFMKQYQLNYYSFSRTLRVWEFQRDSSNIWEFCRGGNIELVARWLSRNKMSPFIVDKYGRNLLHIAAKYARRDLCLFLLGLGIPVDIYDCYGQQALHLITTTRGRTKAGFLRPQSGAASIVNTIRALVEQGNAEPLSMELNYNNTNIINSMYPYRGPEEGFAWIFWNQLSSISIDQPCKMEYGQTRTYLQEAASRLGCFEKERNSGISWPAYYLLRAGADPHQTDTTFWPTPLRFYLTDCPRKGVYHAYEWIEVLRRAGIQLHNYTRREMALYNLHRREPTIYCKSEYGTYIEQKVCFRLGDSANELQIWLEEVDALSWFG